MNDLSKQQLILLALLVSFVTSLATGIVTVALMDQSPNGVVRTITQVIERTVQSASTQNSAVALSPEDKTALAIDNVSKSIVKMKGKNSDVVTGLGLVVSSNGTILTDKSTIAPYIDYEAVTPNGQHVPMAIIESQISGNIVFLAPLNAIPSQNFVPIQFATTTRLGEPVMSLTGTTTTALKQGIIVETSLSDTNLDLQSSWVQTTIQPDKLVAGSPLFNNDGQVIGMATADSNNSGQTLFFLVSSLKSVLPN